MAHQASNRGGCHVDAKNATSVTTIPWAQQTGHLKVVTRAHVTTLEVDRTGRVSGVNYVTDGTEYFQPAKVVLLAGYTYENVRLLLLSKSKAYPGGLSNTSRSNGRRSPPVDLVHLHAFDSTAQSGVGSLSTSS